MGNPAQTTYLLTGTLTNGCVKVDTLNIDVNPLPTLSTSNDTTICEGDTIQIEAFGEIYIHGLIRIFLTITLVALRFGQIQQLLLY